MDEIKKNSFNSFSGDSYGNKDLIKKEKVSKKEKEHSYPISKEEATIIDIVANEAPVTMKKVSQTAKISMSKCAILINNLIKNNLLEKRDVIDAPK